MLPKPIVSLVLCLGLLASACVRAQSNASTNLDARDLPKLLASIQPLIEKGFGQPEVEALQSLYSSIAVKSYGARTFKISYRGEETTMRVELKKDDVDEVDIWFITRPELVKEIQAKIMEMAR